MRIRLLVLLLVAAVLAALAPAPALALSADDSFPGIALPTSPFTGSLSPSGGDVNDCYSLHLDAGDELTLSLRGDAGTDFSLALFNGSIGYEEWESLFWFWQPGYPKETSFVVPEGQAATYSVQVDAFDPAGIAGNYALTWSRRHEKAARLYGMDRYQTAVAVSRSTFATAAAVVLANGKSYADALSAAGLAGALNGPVLLTPGVGAVPDSVLRELQRLQASKIVIVGSENSVSADIERRLSAPPPAGLGYDVDRLGGRNRFATSMLVAERVRELGGSREAFLVSGRSYADALSVSPVAFARKMPIVLTDPKVLSPEAEAALNSLDATHVVVAGSVNAVSAGAAAKAGGILAANDTGAGHRLDRWEGADRFATSTSVAEHAMALGWADWGHAALSTAYDYPDALGGGAAVGARAGVLLLTKPLALSPSTSGELTAHKGGVERVYLLGSANTLRETVRSGVLHALE